ncbi:aspartate/glutamate racemase family protein [Aliiruegeria sabulilitoris]|uniref:aspartate/glutamate racemase family protein n=1 Tax=Aliiruegeria sabulilitoris TaxID=1510458 RepID=UPI00083307F7|nr:aspartate/glutamate racemase family protein [Aliiruegeria sabulilitoris]NDR57737.1 HyuE hydantoin racemase [Pseudoruegeria sp. M32A2M]
MRVLIINPNSTASMTQSMVDAARVAEPDIDVLGWTSHDGPPAIQGPEDGAAAVPPLLDLVGSVGPEIDCVIIGCFDDTGLDEARRIASCPVIGIGQAAFHMSALRGLRFSVVTTLSVSIPVIEQNIERYGMGGFLGRVHASELPVLETEDQSGSAAGRIVETSRAALAQGNCDCIILGCGGMSHLAPGIQRELAQPVIDGVTAAARLARAISRD